MRTVAWLLIVVGLVIVTGAFPYANRATLDNLDAEIRAASRTLDIARAYRLTAMLSEGNVPASAVVSPWPGVMVGGSLLALGMILLALRPPQRGSK